MNSHSFMYQFFLLPLICVGGFGIWLCFGALLPGVGNWLVGVLHVVLVDRVLLGKKGESVWREEP